MQIEVSSAARDVFKSALVWDMTCPWSIGNDELETLHRFRKVGIDLISLTVATDFCGFNVEPVVRQISVTRRFVARNPDFVVIDNAQDILRAKAEGKTALTFNVQGTNPLGGDADQVETFYDLGIRHMLLAYNSKNLAGDGCSEQTDCGLSRFGARVIREMNRVGMILDGTHTGYRTTMEAMEVSTAPFIFSHCGAFSVHAHYRNIKDDQIKACAKTGGVIGINGVGAFLGSDDASTEAMFKHLDYMVQLVGPEHLGIGFDFLRDYERFWKGILRAEDRWPLNDGKPHGVTKYAVPEQLPELTELMLKHGYSDANIRQILGENFLRVAKAVWK